MWRCYIWNFYLSSLRWSQTDVIIWFYCISVSIWSALRQISSNMLAVLILFNFVQKFMSFIMFLKNQILKVCSRQHPKCTFKLTFLDASYVKHQPDVNFGRLLHVETHLFANVKILLKNVKASWHETSLLCSNKIKQRNVIELSKKEPMNFAS